MAPITGDDPLPFGVTLLAGRVRDPAQGIAQARDAERLGFNRVWLSERYDLKEAAVLCGAFAASTERIGIGTALVVDAVRHPLMTAAFGATMQATFGDRFTLGMSRGVRSHLESMGFAFSDPTRFDDHLRVLRELWAGRTVSWDGPAGPVDGLRFTDRLEGPPPRLVYGSFGNPVAAELAARRFDGVLLVPFLTVEAVRRAVGRIRDAAERAGRDPGSVRISHYIVTAPDFDEAQELAVVNARAVTYFQMPGLGDPIVAANRWDPGEVARLRAHPAFAGGSGLADLRFTRDQLLEVARSLPRRWMVEGAALGSARECAERLAEYFRAGVDEIVFHGSSPADNAELLRVWRRDFAGVRG